MVWSHLLGKLRDVRIAPKNDAKTGITVNANMTVEELFKEVAEDTRLRNACILLPHFSDGDAHKHLNTDGHHQRFAQIDCDGVYIEKPFADLDEVTKQKAYGRIDEWGKRRRGIIATGDNRNGTWQRLGVNDCWIKLGEDSVEAVRQALLADEARIAYQRPEVPSERIVEVRVKSTLFEPDLLTITFNPGFSALIGGRGSGKTAILEYLR